MTACVGAVVGKHGLEEDGVVSLSARRDALLRGGNDRVVMRSAVVIQAHRAAIGLFASGNWMESGRTGVVQELVRMSSSGHQLAIKTPSRSEAEGSRCRGRAVRSEAEGRCGERAAWSEAEGRCGERTVRSETEGRCGGRAVRSEVEGRAGAKARCEGRGQVARCEGKGRWQGVQVARCEAKGRRRGVKVRAGGKV